MNPYEEIEDNPYDAIDKIPKTENLLEKIMKVAQVPTNYMGDYAEGFMDTRTLGGTALLRNATQKFTDNTLNSVMGTPDYVRPETERTPGYAAGAITQGGRDILQLGRFAGKAMNPRGFAKKELPKASQNLSKSIQEVIGKSKSDPQKLGVDKNELIKFIKEQYGKSVNPTGREASVFKSWIRTLEGTPKNPSKVGQRVTADVLDEMESQFGKASGFSSKPSNPKLAHAAKEVRRFVSNKVDEIAHNAGVKDFPKASAEKSKLLNLSKAKPGLIGKTARVVGQTALKAGVGAGVGKAIWDMFSN